MMHVGEQVGKNLSISIGNRDVLNIPRCTEHTLYRVITAKQSGDSHDLESPGW